MSLKPQMVDFDQTWGSLRNSVLRIMALQSISRTMWDDHFYDVYALCTALPKDLSQQLYDEMSACLERHASLLHKEILSEPDDQLLEGYCTRWMVYQKGADYVDKMFGYLNNQFIKKQKFNEADVNYGGLSIEQARSNLLEIGELTLDIWKRLMITPLEDKLVKLLLDSISRDRTGESISSSTVKSVLSSFVQVEKNKIRGNLDLYEILFEKKFLEQTAEHFGREANESIQNLDCSSYMQKVLDLLKEENSRSRRFLDKSSYDKVTRVCQEAMVEKHLDYLTSFAQDMVKNEQTQDLLNLYALVKPLAKPDGLQSLVKEFESHVKCIALDCVRNLSGDNIPHQFVEGSLKIHRRFVNIVASVFQNDQEFVAALDRAFLSAVNSGKDSRGTPRASEWLAKYTDFLLKKSAKGLTENEIDDKLSSAIVIFRYIEDKDIFQKHYSRMLAQRLIHGLSVTMDAEESMISKLKNACGYEFTSKLQRMFTDIGLSKDLSSKFTSYLENHNEHLDLGFQIQVLQAGAWPLTVSTTTSMTVPVELLKSVHLFDKFYNSSYSGRKLSWLLHWSSVDVRLNYLDRMYTVTMAVPQLGVLMYFNSNSNNDQCTLKELQNFTEMNEDYLSKNVRSLIDCGLLKADAMELQGSTKLLLNLDITYRKTRFKIPGPTIQKQSEKESEHVNSSVQHDRKYFLECAVVRIMKTRKVCKHNQLIQDVINQSKSRFNPEIAFIKRVIEQLIDKQYLKRTDNPDEYAYLA